MRPRPAPFSLVRPEEAPLNDATAPFRRHLNDIVAAGVAGASAHRLVARALHDAALGERIAGRPVTLVAAGKAAAPMTSAFLEWCPRPVRAGLIADPTPGKPIGPIERMVVGHPVPDAGSASAGRRAIDLAHQVAGDGLLVVLLSGGASAALAAPAAGLTLEDKVQATRALLRGGVPIDRINCVRKHLSRIKGGRLAAAAGAAVTLAISDVVGPAPDDPAVIGSGPTTPDPTSFAEALDVVADSAVRSAFPRVAREVLTRGRQGLVPETPKPGDPRLEQSWFHLIGSRRDALDAAARCAAGLGYHVVTLPGPVIGEARAAGGAHVRRAAAQCGAAPRPACILSSGETIVKVTGSGRGGRNQEFALAAAEPLAALFDRAALASVGTDGIDGPTDAAGAIVDTTTLARARDRGDPEPRRCLDRNDSYSFFDRLGDLVRTGPTRTNVGDLQVMLIG